MNAIDNNLPAYNTARGGADATLEIKPPFDFSGVTARVFPLKANMHQLRAFCDHYLNIMPDTIAKFQPTLPYVYLMVLNYGKMLAKVENLGWVSQHEVTFTVPLERYRRENGQLVFQDWAYVSPFIFVDNEMSLRGGREVYGWPKVMAWLDPEISTWVSNPRNPPRLLTLSTMVFPEVYAGEEQQPRVLLEINHEPPPTFSQFPPDPNNPFNPLLSIPKAILGSLSMMGNFIEVLTGLSIMGYSQQRYSRVFNLPSLRNMIVRGFKALNVFSSDLYSNEITLKQFRGDEYPNHACYQAIVNSRMAITKYNDGGMLGDVDLLRGDPTGGFKIKIHRYTAQPIIESLGLEAKEEGEEEGTSAATLKPTFPFWIDADLHYGLGNPICWRSRTSRWYTATTAESPQPEAHQEGDDRTETGFLYNTTRGAATQEIGGPFYYPDIILRVLPLMADETRLKEFCQQYLANDFYRFEPLSPYVLLFVSNFEALPETNSIGWVSFRQLAFAVPVKWYDRDDNLISWATVWPFVFEDGSMAAITAREVLGLPALYASLESPRDTWMEDPQATEKGLLTLRTMVLPVLNLGQRAEERVLLEIRKMEEPHPSGPPPEIDATKKYEQDFPDSGAPAQAVLTHGGLVNMIALKQFRSAAYPDYACYQSIIQQGLHYDPPKIQGEIGGPIDVSIHRYPDQPIVEVLGLKVERTEILGGIPVDHLRPVRPGWARTAMKEELGKTLCWRAGTERWTRGWIPDPSYFKGDGLH